MQASARLYRKAGRKPKQKSQNETEKRNRKKYREAQADLCRLFCGP